MTLRPLLHLPLTTLICTLLALPALAWTNLDPRVSNREYLVIAYDGTQHLLTMQYRSDLRWRSWQTGRASKPGKLRFKDDRQCHYEIVVGNGKRAISSINLATGRQDWMLNDIASRVEGPPSASIGDLNGYAQRFLFGPFINTVEEAERLDDIVDAINWDVDKPLDVLVGPLGTLAAVAEAGFSGFRVVGNALGRAIGLRTGINCGEAAGIINAQVSSTRDIHYGASAALERVDYYLSIIQLRTEWAYLNSDTGQYVGAAWIEPTEFVTDYNKIFELEAQRLADEVVGEQILLSAADRRDLNSFEVNATLRDNVLEATLPRPLAALEGAYAAAAPGLDQQVTDLVALFPPDIYTRLHSFPLQLAAQPPAADNTDLLLSLSANLATRTVTVPNCIVPRYGRATWHGTIADDPAVADQILKGWRVLMNEMSALGDEALRIDGYAAILPEAAAAPYLERTKAIIDALEARRETVSVVERFIDAKIRCTSTYITNDALRAMMLEIQTEEDWEEVRDIIRGGGVSDPPRNDDLRRALERDVFSSDTLVLPDSIRNLNALNTQLGSALQAR